MSSISKVRTWSPEPQRLGGPCQRTREAGAALGERVGEDGGRCGSQGGL